MTITKMLNTLPTHCQHTANTLPTHCQHTANTLPTTDKNENNIKKENKEDLLGDKPPKKPKKQFTIPTLEEIQAYCLERKNTINPQYFYDYYEVRGWIPKNSKQQMKDWKAAVRTWEKNDQTPKPPKPPTQPLVKTPEQIFKENRKKLEDEQKARAEFKFDE